MSGAALVALDAAAAAGGAHAPWLSLAALVLAPGLALAPLLPCRIRRSPVGTVAAAPVLGLAASSVALVSAASGGVALHGVPIRFLLAALVVIGFLLPWPELERPPRRADLAPAAGLAAALVLGALLQQRVIGGDPIPGNDWAKYLLYADEIRRHGSLLIDNPFWMLGVPFREDPAVPALYGSFLSLSGEPAAVLTHGIWVLAATSILSVFALTRAFWGDLAGVLAAALWAALPMSQDILAWHGAPNLAAICLLGLVLGYLAVLVKDGLDPPEVGGFALMLVALAAAHRLSLVLGVMAIVTAVAAGVAAGGARRIVRAGGATLLLAALLGAGVLYDLVERGRSFGPTQGYQAYLTTKVDIGPLVGDLTLVFTVLAIGAVALAARTGTRDPAGATLLCLLAATVTLAYAWIVHVPAAYFRMAYFLPLALVPLVAAALVRLLPARAAAVVGGGAALVIAGFAWPQAEEVRDFYAFSNSGSLRGLDAVGRALRPGEVVVTDRCWSFQAAWLLHTRTLAALEPEDIQPSAELRRARQARAVLDGTPAGLALARRLGVRFLVVDPTCADARERPTRPPKVGRAVYVSQRLVVLRLPPA